MVWVGDEVESDEEKDISRQNNYEDLEPIQTTLQSNQASVWNPGKTFCCIST